MLDNSVFGIQSKSYEDSKTTNSVALRKFAWPTRKGVFDKTLLKLKHQVIKGLFTTFYPLIQEPKSLIFNMDHSLLMSFALLALDSPSLVYAGGREVVATQPSKGSQTSSRNWTYSGN